MLKKIIWFISLPFVYLLLIFKILFAKRKAKKYKKNPDDYLESDRYKTVYSLAKLFLYTKNIKISSLGDENDKIISKSQLVISNHRSNIDPILIYAYLYNKTSIRPVFVAKKELSESFLSFVFDLVDTIYIDRSNLRQMVSSIDNQVEILKSNKILVIFPEGTRNTNDELLEFKSGAFECAYKTMSPIQPIVIRNQELYMENKKEKNNSKKEIRFSLLQPYQPSTFIQIDRNIFSQKVREKMQDEFDKLNN